MIVVQSQSLKFLYDGPDMVSTGSRVGEWTARQAINVKEAKQVNANANTNGIVKVTVSKTAFFGRVAANDSAIALAA